MLLDRPDSLISPAALSSTALGFIGAITQSDLAVWAGGIVGIGGAVLFLADKYRRSTIETQRLERDAILADARAEIRDLRRELHDTRDALNEARIALAVAKVQPPAAVAPIVVAAPIPTDAT